MYEIPGTGLFESTTINERLEFASIESLKKELNEQYGIIHFREDKADDEDEDEILIRETKLNEVIAKSDSLWIVCKEGVSGGTLLNLNIVTMVNSAEIQSE